MLNVTKLQRKTFANKFTGDDALQGSEVIEMFREIKRLQEENKELKQQVLYTESPREDYDLSSIEKQDLIEAMSIADEEDSLDAVRYALNKTREGVMQIEL